MMKQDKNHRDNRNEFQIHKGPKISDLVSLTRVMNEPMLIHLALWIRLTLKFSRVTKTLTKSWRYSCWILKEESSDKTPSHDFDGIIISCIPCWYSIHFSSLVRIWEEAERLVQFIVSRLWINGMREPVPGTFGTLGSLVHSRTRTF